MEVRRSAQSSLDGYVELSIICVNWNSGDYLLECIRSIQLHTKEISFEIIVVDNASTTDGLGPIVDEFPSVLVMRSDRNLGFAGANNQAFRASRGEYVVFLNPDTQLLGPALDTMLRHIKDLPDAGVIGCKLLNTDLSVQLSSIQRFPTILNQALDAEYLRLRWPHCRLWAIAPLFATNVHLMKVDVIPGACMMLRREVFANVGMFSEDYFMYAEDLDLNYKLKAAGFVNYYVGDTAIIHHGGRSSSRQEVSHWSTIMQSNAMLRLFSNQRGRAYAATYRLAMGVVALARVAVLAAASSVGGASRSKPSLKHSQGKWMAILRWSLGRGDAPGVGRPEIAAKTGN